MNPFRFQLLSSLVPVLFTLLLFGIGMVTDASGQHERSYHPGQETAPLSDSTLLKQFVYETRIAWASEEATDSMSEEVIDSLLWENRSSIGEATFLRAPDDRFTLFVIEGESCGAYCNPWWESFLRINATGQTTMHGEFSNVERIEVLPDGKYLIIESQYGRPASVFTVFGYAARVISFENDSLVLHPFTYRDKRYGDEEEGAFSFSQENGHESDPYMIWDAEKQRLNYQYAVDLNYCCQTDSAYLYRGHFEYIKGRFVWRGESKKYKSMDW